MPDDVILEMRGIKKAFHGVAALEGVSLTVRRGEVHALVGENGAGKSTLMKILAGAYTADEGEIRLRGETVRFRGPRNAQQAGIGIIYQELNLIPELNVTENIFLGREFRNRCGWIDWSRMYQEASLLLSRLGVHLDLRAPVAGLSVAQQQMVEIAKALSLEADVLVMDEPSAVLAGPELERLHQIIATLRSQGLAIVYISHRMDELFALCDRATVLKDGRLVQTVELSDVTRGDLVRMMVGRSLDQYFPLIATTPGETILEVEGLSSPSGINQISFSLRRGEILGVAGLVGSGRTTLARTLFGVETRSAGSVTLAGQSLQLKDPRQARDQGLALVPEDRKTQGLIQSLTVRRNASLALLDRLSLWGFISTQKEESLAREYVTAMSIKTAGIDQEVQFLSGGNQQKVVLAKWLATQPQVIILDEPTRGVDVGAKAEIYAIMRKLTRQGAAILMISSELPEVLGMADRIMVMSDGRLAGTLDRSEATEEKIMALATSQSSQSEERKGGARLGSL